MRLSRVLFVCVPVLSTALIVRADGISSNDPPKIIVGRGGSSTSITMLNVFESVPIASAGGGVSTFLNATGQTATGLTLDVIFKNPGKAKALVSPCDTGAIFDPATQLATNIFTTCQADVVSKNKVEFIFAGGTISPNSPNNDFFVDLNTKDNSFHPNKHGDGGDWIKNGDSISVELTALTAAAPEPGVLLLLLSGLGGIWLLRKRG